MGMPLTVEEGVGPRFGWRLEDPKDIRRLDAAFDVEDKLGWDLGFCCLFPGGLLPSAARISAVSQGLLVCLPPAS